LQSLCGDKDLVRKTITSSAFILDKQLLALILGLGDLIEIAAGIGYAFG
jgi:hypothetical protein